MTEIFCFALRAARVYPGQRESVFAHKQKVCGEEEGKQRRGNGNRTGKGTRKWMWDFEENSHDRVQPSVFRKSSTDSVQRDFILMSAFLLQRWVSGIDMILVCIAYFLGIIVYFFLSFFLLHIEHTDLHWKQLVVFALQSLFCHSSSVISSVVILSGSGGWLGARFCLFFLTLLYLLVNLIKQWFHSAL